MAADSPKPDLTPEESVEVSRPVPELVLLGACGCGSGCGCGCQQGAPCQCGGCCG
ncbi:hypothetical protein [Streptomyces beihaiensis]|uniref:Uncharacterized protein n=1 Tax=Streptomyces beihaiensis TaxID=2984495 RepID=A0ABT3TWZ1_9ACTN|nr:hypothetical protein [Streptomyces beihaiensis]MCX3061567.1 hypothetical protein [Streptomyces beihaiensis]